MPVDRLRAIPLFADLGDSALGRIAEHVTEFEAPAGQVLIEAKMPGAGLFVIEEGTVTVDLPGGKTAECGPGDFFGEMALLDERTTRMARVHAKTAVRCLAISRSDFAKMLEEEPRLAVPMLRALARRLADAQRA